MVVSEFNPLKVSHFQRGIRKRAAQSSVLCLIMLYQHNHISFGHIWGASWRVCGRICTCPGATPGIMCEKSVARYAPFWKFKLLASHCTSQFLCTSQSKAIRFTCTVCHCWFCRRSGAVVLAADRSRPFSAIATSQPFY